MSAVGVSESGVRPILAEAVDLARHALLELEPLGVGRHIGVTAEDDSAATHHFEATLPGYRGWQWAVVVAAPPEATKVTVSESALLPGPDALVAPDFLPWDQRIRPGDLAPGDLLAPPLHDPRLVPGYIASGDPVVDEVALELGLGRPRVLSREGREEAADRWFSEFGPDTDMARAAPATCGTCGFFVPLAGGLRAAFGVCANAMGADGRVVSLEYGCGAHSDTELPTGAGSPAYEAYDDAAVEFIPAEELRKPEPAAAETDSAPEESSPTETVLTDTASAAAAEIAPTTVEDKSAATEIADSAETGAEASSTVAESDSVGNSAIAAAAIAESATAEASVPPVANTPVVAEAIAESATAEAIAAVAEVTAVSETATAEAVPAESNSAADETVAERHSETTAPPRASAIPDFPTDNGIPALFDLADPDLVVDDAWGVSAVRVEAETTAPQAGDAGAPEPN